MDAAPARAALATHEVLNQPPPRADLDLYAVDRALAEAVRREGGEWVDARCRALGEAVGSAAVLELGAEANRHPPELRAFDRWGRRLDEVRFHPSWHLLMALAMEHGVHDVAWAAGRPGGHVAHAALLAVFTQAEAGVMCPMTMTYAAVPALRTTPQVAAPWLARLVGGRYD
ncbi:MAG: DNA alkylation response protein, partial [Caulobacteraceae bacterium]|nr:DNA alkylation response protein [Caulobacter sp.]